MEMEIMSKASIAVFSLIFFFLVWKVLNRVWFQPKKLERRLREEGFKGNSYRFFYGDSREISAMRKEAMAKPLNISDDIVPRVVPHFLHTINKHGKNSFMWFGQEPWVVITNPEFIKEVTNNNNQGFSKPSSAEFFKWIAQGIASENGDVYNQHKKIINPAFHQEKLKLMIPSFSESASEMLRQWEKIVSVKGSSSAVLDVWPYIQNLSSDALSRTAFGSNYEEGRRIYELQKEQILHCMKSSAKIPGWSLLPNKKNRRLKETVKIINSLIIDMINTRMEKVKAGNDQQQAWENDLLSILLKEINEEGGSRLSIGDVVEDCKLFFFAGQETTAVLLVWTMVLLSRFPEWQTRAREEAFHVFGTNLPNSDGLNRLKVINMILYEVLRLYPPVSQFLRTTTKETKLGNNICLPAGVHISLQVMLVHHDKELWGEDAKEFNPERFAEGISKATNGKLIYFPFGWGSRICIGQNFALLEARISLAMILQKFSFELSPLYTHAPYSAITVNPQFGAHLILNKL